MIIGILFNTTKKCPLNHQIKLISLRSNKDNQLPQCDLLSFSDIELKNNCYSPKRSIKKSQDIFSQRYSTIDQILSCFPLNHSFLPSHLKDLIKTVILEWESFRGLDHNQAGYFCTSIHIFHFH